MLDGGAKGLKVEGAGAQQAGGEAKQEHAWAGAGGAVKYVDVVPVAAGETTGTSEVTRSASPARKRSHTISRPGF